MWDASRQFYRCQLRLDRHHQKQRPALFETRSKKPASVLCSAIARLDLDCARSLDRFFASQIGCSILRPPVHYAPPPPTSRLYNCCAVPPFLLLLQSQHSETAHLSTLLYWVGIRCSTCASQISPRRRIFCVLGSLCNGHRTSCLRRTRNADDAWRGRRGNMKPLKRI